MESGASMSNLEIAAAAERSLTSQTDLITTLSLAVIGGLVAVIIRVRTHNATSNNCFIFLHHAWLMWLALCAAVIAIGLSYAISGMVVQVSPQLYSHAFDTTKAFSDQTFEIAPIGQVMMLSFIQFVAFLVSAICTALFAGLNSRS